MKRIRYIYIAGPYTSAPAGNVEVALGAAEQLTKMGLIPFVPHLYHFWNADHPHDYAFWTELDFAWLSKCDSLFRISGRSEGANREEAVARALGFPVFYRLEEVSDYVSQQMRLQIDESLTST